MKCTGIRSYRFERGVTLDSNAGRCNNLVQDREVLASQIEALFNLSDGV